MSCFDDGNYNNEESFPCVCGGSIVLFQGKWICSDCGKVMGG